MDNYKKKSLKFNSIVRREIRHAETVKARESSRFKRLSMLRCLDEEEPSFEKCEEKTTEGLINKNEIKEVKKPVSRLEILHKWRNEKIIKKELEKKNCIRPFYAGASSLISTNKGVSKIANCNQSSGNTISFSKVPPHSSSLVPRVPNTSKQVPSCISNPISRLPNSSKQVSCNSLPTSRIPNSSNQGSYSANPTSRTQIGSKPPVNSKTTKIIKPQLQRYPSSNQELAKKPSAFGNNPKTNQVLPKSKIQMGASSPAKGFQSRLAKPGSVVPKRNPIQSKLPVVGIPKPIAASNKKIPTVSSTAVKLPAPSFSQKPTPGLLKKPGIVSKLDLEKAPPISGNRKQDKKALPEASANRSKEPSVVDVMPEEKSQVQHTYFADSKPESGSERNNESLSDIFDCDVSMIKPTSFAPENFKFKPPSEVLDISFDFSILRRIKEFTSRTSTPTKIPVEETKSCESNKEIKQEPSENKAIEIQISTSPRQLAQSFAKEDDKEIIQKPSECLDIETNISTSPRQPVQCSVNNDDKETIQKPSECLDIETNLVTSKPGQECENFEDDNEIMQRSSENIKSEIDVSTQPKPSIEASVRDEDDFKETMHKQSEDIDIKVDIVTSKPGQECENSEDDNEIMQRSSENEINVISPSEDLVQDLGKSPLTNLQYSSNSSQPVCRSTSWTDLEAAMKDCVAETEKLKHPPSNGGVDEEKYKESLPVNVFPSSFKRRSILKKSTLNSIAETEDTPSPATDEDASENKENILCKMARRSRRVSNLISIEGSPSSSPRRSQRISNLISLDESPSKTPRRSQRISNLISLDESPSTTPRRSLRLQQKISSSNQHDSNPVCSSHTSLTNDFEKLTLEEDFDIMNPNDYLYDFDDAFDSPEKRKSRKVSLLYSPEKRMSIRRSIRGDLISFSPNKSPRV